MAEKKTTNRTDAVELVDMALSDLKKVAVQLGIENASTLKKAELVQSIGDLQANREAAKNEREARRMERQNNRNNKNNLAEAEENESSQDSSPNNSSNNSSGGYGDSDRGDNNRRFGNRDHNRRDRGRDRNRDRNRDRGNREEREIVIGPDDVLLPVGGLLDILDSFALH